ncbi:hypothetical protein D917_01281 [Trichinella nativa]|uniref:CCHC-type domain-containing protein n=1 Tax=Trichinella nativa TaxID=6335 RepID=A0A1Y3ES91_9BILA|nr:hypothetical protein D917_01281 [Trichinella nativa]
MLHEKAIGKQLPDQLNLHVRVFRALGKDFTSSRITAAEVMLELFEFTFLFVIRKKWEEEVFLDDAKNSDLAWFPSFLKKQKQRQNLSQTVVLSVWCTYHPSPSEIFQATPEERWSLCEKRGLCFYCLYKGHVAKRCSKKKRCGKAAWNLKHHGLLHQSGTMGNLKPAMGGYTS